MKIYQLTDLSRAYLKKHESDGSDDYKTIAYIRDRCGGSATENDLEIVAERYQLKKLCEQGLLKELTQ